MVLRPGSGLSPGDRVAAFVRRGGWAELAACRADFVFPLPADIAYREAAALPLNYLTVHLALLRRARLRRGESVVVLGASGGIGTAAIQLARAMGARTIAVSSSQAGAEARLAPRPRGGHRRGLGGAGRNSRVARGDVVSIQSCGPVFEAALWLVKPRRLLVIGRLRDHPRCGNRPLLRNIDLMEIAGRRSGPT